MKALRLLIPVLFVALCCRVILVAGDSHQSAARAPPSISKKAIHIEGKKKKKVFKLSSSAFPHAGLLPFDSSCWVNGTRNSGDGISPPLSWVNIPKGTKHIALLAHNQSINIVEWFTVIGKKHRFWKTGLPVNIPRATDNPSLGIYQKVNDLGVSGYSGPCPASAERQLILGSSRI